MKHIWSRMVCRTLLCTHRRVQEKAVQRKYFRDPTSPATISSSCTSGLPTSLRNIGIIAHIDAGKTTTAERFLYYSGHTRSLGDVDTGDTVMDYLPQEQARGITISAAAVTFPWRKARITLIDTPGHVDFTIEVERSLRVLDGAVVIVDGVSGVQSQTETVWQQAERYQIPKVVYVNKMDREGAEYLKALKSVETRLCTRVLPLQMPLFAIETGEMIIAGSISEAYEQFKKQTNGQGWISPEFVGVCDLVDGKMHTWNGKDPTGREFGSGPIKPEMIPRYAEFRSKMLETLAEVDDECFERFVSNSEWDAPHWEPSYLQKRIRVVTIQRRVTPAFCGAAFKNRAVQPLLDAVINYLPSPLDRGSVIASENDHDISFSPDPSAKLCAFAFKVINDTSLGGNGQDLVFLRIYSGTIEPGLVWNPRLGGKERILRLYRMQADSTEEVPSLSAGEIGVAIGLKETMTGDTLLSPDFFGHFLHLRGLPVPSAVFFCSISPRSKSDEQSLHLALTRLQREDPTFRVRNDVQTGQTLMEGMGKLHLEIVCDRLQRDYRAEFNVGAMHIAYRESLVPSCTQDLQKICVHMEVHSGKRFSKGKEGVASSSTCTVEVTLSIEHLHEYQSRDVVIHTVDNDLLLLLTKEWTLDTFRKEMSQWVYSSLDQGLLAHYPLYGIRVHIHNVRVKETSGAIPFIRSCLSRVMQELYGQEEVGECTPHASSFDKIQGFSHNMETSIMPPIPRPLALISSKNIHLLEPIMRLRLVLRDTYLGNVLGDLTHGKRAQILNVGTNLMNELPDADPGNPLHGGLNMGVTHLVEALVPLSSLMDYANELRSRTQGTSSYSMEFVHYDVVNGAERDRLCTRIENDHPKEGKQIDQAL